MTVTSDMCTCSYSLIVNVEQSTPLLVAVMYTKLQCGGCVCYCVRVVFVIVWGVMFINVWGLYLFLCGHCVFSCVGVVFVIVWRLCLLLCGGLCL